MATTELTTLKTDEANYFAWEYARSRTADQISKSDLVDYAAEQGLAFVPGMLCQILSAAHTYVDGAPAPEYPRN